MAKKAKAKRTPKKTATRASHVVHETVAGPPPVLAGQQALPGVPPVVLDATKTQPPTLHVPLGAAVVMTGPGGGGGSGTVAAAQAPITGQITTTVVPPETMTVDAGVAGGGAGGSSAATGAGTKRKRRPVAPTNGNGHGNGSEAVAITGYQVELRGTVNDMLVAEAQKEGISWDRAGQIIPQLVEDALLARAQKEIGSTVVKGAAVVAIKEAVKEATKAIGAATALLNEIVGPTKPAPIDEPPPGLDFEEAYLARVEGRA